MKSIIIALAASTCLAVQSKTDTQRGNIPMPPSEFPDFIIPMEYFDDLVGRIITTEDSKLNAIIA